ncbi:unnamed protein product [Didymodactylos carnosus]|uniref:Uncharacterized protein n=1 Tax=Didymodactylos carnosus TaxID=1234261 RepID=A0A815QQH9_9BILA|nr:unnamed protein product [Didymodactylos carnosus]CAF1467051.1 unnamed protein product [Didymodactylos carnosus]CAF3677639.1 unnamed protein product [Didymodactylos carnosus]CAF4335860.1 unnamed protein product [Didymodactylos carnosus]
MSKTYMDSGNCEQEAKYAKQCRRTLIPLIVMKEFRPTGWLGFLTADLKYIDFTRHPFYLAMPMLLEEIEAYRQKKTTAVAASDQLNIV